MSAQPQDLARHRRTKDLKRVLLQNAESVLSEWYPNGRLRNGEFAVGSVSGEDGESLKVNVKTGAWCDFAAPDQFKGGDLLALYEAKERIDWKAAYDRLAPKFGFDAGDDAPPPLKREAPKVDVVPLMDFHGRDDPKRKFYEYFRVEDGLKVLWFAIERVERPDGGKDFFPIRAVLGSDGEVVVERKAFPEPRLLYRLPDLEERTASPRVIVVEGEKAADHLGKEIANPVLSWSGGARAWRKTDWSPLKGREVLLWPDNDEPGRAAMQGIGEHLAGLGCTVKLLPVPDELKAVDGGDAADLEGDALLDVLKAMLAGAKEVCPDARMPDPLPTRKGDLTPPSHVAPEPDGDDAATPTPAADRQIEEFRYLAPAGKFVFMPTRDLWPAKSVDARIGKVRTGAQHPVLASTYISRTRAVEQLTWSPGDPELIRDVVFGEAGRIAKPGARVINLYRPAPLTEGDPTQAGPWLDHVRRVVGDSAFNHTVQWFAHRVQRPGEKLNHAFVLGGAPGIGKDTLLDPVVRAVGDWNVAEIAPAHLLGRFNPYVRSVILRISEARDLGDIDRFAFYDRSKVLIAAPPDTLRVDTKNVPEYSIPSVCGVLFTTNYRDALYLPPDDRRHFVVWSEATPADFDPIYFRGLWAWFGSGGSDHVAAYLRMLDLSTFDPKAPPPKTPAFWTAVDAGRAPEDAELRDALDVLKTPAAVTIDDIRHVAADSFRAWLEDRRSRRQMPHRFAAAGYVPVRNDAAEDGLWRVWGRRQVIYARETLSLAERMQVAAQLALGSRQ
ncbi:MAG: hypothetical protein IT518_29260 [Burkholderiales bacterium]|nr:hypothetical protein [Burkholderiales bacterium]